MLHTLQEEVWPTYGEVTAVTTGQGVLVPATAVVQQGECLKLFLPSSDAPLCVPAMPKLPPDVAPFLEPVCPTALRVQLLSRQELWMADDQVACLQAIAGNANRPIQVIDPLLMLSALQGIGQGRQKIGPQVLGSMADVELICCSLPRSLGSIPLEAHCRPPARLGE